MADKFDGTGEHAYAPIVENPEIRPDDWYDEGEDWDEPEFCFKCQNTGYFVVCVDDLCHGAGWCMHDAEKGIRYCDCAAADYVVGGGW